MIGLQNIYSNKFTLVIQINYMLMNTGSDGKQELIFKSSPEFCDLWSKMVAKYHYFFFDIVMALKLNFCNLVMLNHIFEWSGAIDA